MYANLEAGCSCCETDLSAETEHFDHGQAHMQADVHRGYCLSSPLLGKGALKIRIMGDWLVVLGLTAL